MARNIIEGVLQGNVRGYAFLMNEEFKEDYFIPHSDLRGAMHGDRVLCEITNGSGIRTTARVLKILERGIKELVGTYFTSKRGGFVTPDDDKYYKDIFIPFGKGLRAKAGDKVVCKILSYPKNKNPEGIISKIFGRQFNKDAELKSIEYTYKLIPKFPKNVVDEAEENPKEISKNHLSKREDLRDLITVTIDGDDSRDFDDAVSIEKTNNGYRLGVHIADVSEYVKPNSLLDKEAFNRGTSVYFPESVIPMLPERLSCDLCSLIEGKDRLTLSCIMDIDRKGNVIDKKIVPSVIKSRARLTYSTVQKLLDGKIEIIKNKEITENLLLMDELASILKEKRIEKGSIDLSVKESAISVDKKTGEITVSAFVQNKARKIIEEFMICANCTVAEYFYFLDIPFIYRIHDEPTEERLENFYIFLNGLGISPKRRKEEVFSKDFQLILSNAENSPAYSVINKVMLRAMQKAKYSPEEKGHFGLSEKYYCHFTSPIRRYPDLAIHRIIKDFLSGGYESLNEKYNGFVIEASNQSSLKERNAMEAERAVDDYYKMLYISNYEGEEFDGYISGVASFGLFVELDNGIEGFVKLETLKGKKYEFNKDRYTLSNGAYCYKLGEKVRIMVSGVNLIDRRAEFVITSLAKKNKV